MDEVPPPPGDPLTIIILTAVIGYSSAILLSVAIVIYACFAPLEDTSKADKQKRHDKKMAAKEKKKNK